MSRIERNKKFNPDNIVSCLITGYIHKLREGSLWNVYCDVTSDDKDGIVGKSFLRGEKYLERSKKWSKVTCPDCKQDCRDLFPNDPQPPEDEPKEPEKGLYVYLDDDMCHMLACILGAMPSRYGHRLYELLSKNGYKSEFGWNGKGHNKFITTQVAQIEENPLWKPT